MKWHDKIRFAVFVAGPFKYYTTLQSMSCIYSLQGRQWLQHERRHTHFALPDEGFEPWTSVASQHANH